MSKFKVGDVIFVYGMTDKGMPIKQKAFVDHVYEDKSLGLDGPRIFKKSTEYDDGWDLTLAHPKQCRKLKIRK